MMKTLINNAIIIAKKENYFVYYLNYDFPFFISIMCLPVQIFLNLKKIMQAFDILI